MSEADLRAAIVRWGKSLFERGLTAGSSGNISVRLGDRFLVTPTNACLGFLDPDSLSIVDRSGQRLSGEPPTKEVPLHFGFYARRLDCQAVVHLHSTYATALSCLADTDPSDAIAPITPYVVMRVGRVPVAPYLRPGSPEVKQVIEALAVDHSAILLQNHGPVVAGRSLDAAVYAIEELEEAAKLNLILRGLNVRPLSADAIADLNRSFDLR